MDSRFGLDSVKKRKISVLLEIEPRPQPLTRRDTD
jgi:hypothetical protein